MPNLTKDPSVLEITDKIAKNASSGRYVVSDAIVREGGREYQYVDLVLEGGGTLGIALVGYIHALEQAGIRFLGIGGSSVGAIVALLAYSCGGRDEAKGEKLAAMVSELNLSELVDGKFFARGLSRLMGNRHARLRKARIQAGILINLPLLFNRFGLNPGDKLFEWITAKMAENGVRTLEDLNKLVAALPKGLTNRETGEPITEYDTSLRIVTADITTSTKVVFPDMAAMYWQNPDAVNPACFARAASSIPGFFQPFTVEGISNLIGKSEKWEQLGNFTGPLPNRVMFADGGLMSNFPIDLFKRIGVPKAPTFGARLGKNQRTVKDTDKLWVYAYRLFTALQHYADYDFIYKNQMYRHLITYINTDRYNWLDFNMDEAKMLGLFREGVFAAHKFLDTFDWAQHKKQRTAEAEASRRSC